MIIIKKEYNNNNNMETIKDAITIGELEEIPRGLSIEKFSKYIKLIRRKKKLKQLYPDDK